VVRGEIGDRRRRHADVDHVGAGGIEAFGERLGELGPGQAAVASDRERAALRSRPMVPSARPMSRTMAGVSVLPTMPRMS
jgi:hypothetical protein